MQTALVVLRLALAAVFATAGVGKLLDRHGSRQALADFGVPRRFTAAAAIALPTVELAVALGLVIRPTAQPAAAIGVILLLLFVAGIAGALARGRAPDCHCFGQIHSSPAGAGTLARNAGLALIAGFVAAAGPGPAIVSWVSAGRGHAFVLGGLLLLILAVVVLAGKANMRAQERERARAAEPQGLPIGAHAPAFEASKLAGGSVDLESLLGRGKPALLVFAHPRCGPCGDLLPDIARWEAALRERLTVAVISWGDEIDNQLAQARHKLTELYLQRGTEIYRAYKTGATPSAVLVSTDGRIASATVQGRFAIEQLIRLALRRTSPEDGTREDSTAFGLHVERAEGGARV